MVGKTANISSVLLDGKNIPFDDGIFVFGFDRDDKGTHTIKIIFKNGAGKTKKFKLEKGNFKIEKINSAKKQFSSPPANELARIEHERKEMKNARRRVGKINSALFESGFERPVKGGKVTGVFGSQRILNGKPKSPHDGFDIAAPKGTPVYAMADGVVILAGKNFYYNGNFILIDHGLSLSSIYLHLNKMFVKNGDRVKKGEKIGEIGTTGRSTGPHLHWSVRWMKKRINPESVLKIGQF
ncbi:MAG: M23 family metallopeptidase [Chlorobi bacterium]|nr:M23 family metallopeptidase [Chlorobiota bacterium]